MKISDLTTIVVLILSLLLLYLNKKSKNELLFNNDTIQQVSLTIIFIVNIIYLIFRLVAFLIINWDNKLF